MWLCRLILGLILSLLWSHALQLPQHTRFTRPQFRLHQSQPHFDSATNDHPPPPYYSVRLSSDQLLPRPNAMNLIDTIVLPTTEKGYRMNLNSQDIVSDDRIDVDSSTYGEFSLTSLDIILDRITQEIINVNDAMDSNTDTGAAKGQNKPLKIIDIGSGCGRLVLYMAITQQQRLRQYCDQIVVMGIEQSNALHDESIRATERLLQQFTIINNSKNGNNSTTQMQQEQAEGLHCTNTEIRLYCGSAQDFMNEIHTADIIICYSTAFSSGHFLPSISALLLSEEWNTILTPPTVVSSTDPLTLSSKMLYCVTMDKALDPSRGWIMMDRITVPNPEIGVDSMAFLQQLLHRPIL